jgi:hypothetical protein
MEPPGRRIKPIPLPGTVPIRQVHARDACDRADGRIEPSPATLPERRGPPQPESAVPRPGEPSR